VAGALSQLGPTPGGGRPAFLRLALSGTDLASPQALAARCPHVQDARLPGNALASLRGLGSLACLTHLDASRNRLTAALDLSPAPGSGPGGAADAGPPPAALSLRSADLSRNRIWLLGGLSAFAALERLNLGGNCLRRLGGSLAGLPRLRELSLRGNGLESCEGLQGAAGKGCSCRCPAGSWRRAGARIAAASPGDCLRLR
jgi:Leucine-rich repeat (LRR) protein